MRIADLISRRGRPLSRRAIDRAIMRSKMLAEQGGLFVDCARRGELEPDSALDEWLIATEKACRIAQFALAEFREEVLQAQLRGVTDEKTLKRMSSLDLIYPVHSLSLTLLTLNSIMPLDHAIVAKVGGTYATMLMQIIEIAPDDESVDKLALLAPVSKCLPDIVRALLYCGMGSVAVTFIDRLTNLSLYDHHVDLVRPPTWTVGPAEENALVRELLPLLPNRYLQYIDSDHVDRVRGEMVSAQAAVGRRHGPAVVAASAVAANITPFVAAELADRDAVFVGTSLGGEGFALRVTADGSHDGLILKNFGRDHVVELKRLERNARRSVAAKEISDSAYQAAIWSLVIRLGAVVVEPILQRWSDLSRCTFVPIGLAFGLPYTAAHFLEEYRRTGFNMTVCPSARTMMLAALSARHSGSAPAVFIAGDAAQGRSRIPFVVDEVDAIARIWGLAPRVFNRHAIGVGLEDRVERPYRELSNTVGDPVKSTPAALLDEIKLADIVHLSCHGFLSSQGRPRADLLIDGILDMGQLQASGFRPGATAVLSACSVGGFDSRYTSEILGFPTVVLGAGARNLIASMWPVPDSAQTVDLMCAVHGRLFDGESTEEAFVGALASAIDSDVSPSVWAGFSLFGV